MTDPPPAGGRRPFGYQADRRHLRRAEAFALLDAAERVLAGESLAAVVADWNERGITTPGGRPWTTGNLRRVLVSGRVAGWRERGGRLTEKADWPAIIDLDAHIRLRSLLNDPAGRARSYVLSGLVFCGACGHKMVARPAVQGGVKRRRYVCAGDHGGCNRVGISADHLEGLVFGEIARRHRPAPARSAGRVPILEARLDDLAARYARAEISPAEWERARGEIVAQLEAARRAVVVPPPEAHGGDWPFAARRAAALAAVARIDIAARGGGNRFDADRVTVTWKA